MPIRFMAVQRCSLQAWFDFVCVCVCDSVCKCMMYSVTVCVTLHVLTVDTGRVWAAALITRTFISPMREVPLQNIDLQVKASHVLTY